MITRDFSGFLIAPYSLDGPLTDPVFCNFKSLSEDWLEVCGSFLRMHGPVLHAEWGEQLGGIGTRLTSSNGAGVGTFFFDRTPVLFTLYAAGIDPVADEEVLGMFIEMTRNFLSLQQQDQAAGIPDPLETLPTLADRPLTSVMVLPGPGVNENQFNMIRELSTHFAAAFFRECFSLTPFGAMKK